MTSRDSVKQSIKKAAIQCFSKKCISSRSSKIDYISPQELLKNLPESLGIYRYHIQKRHSGQWEIKNKNIRCYIGFQVITNDINTKNLIKDLVSENSELYRREHGIRDYKDELNEKGDCYICGEQRFIINPEFGRHICKVHGSFTCYEHKKPNKFTVGRCLLDPKTEQPATRYACAVCGYFASFVKYSLRKRQYEEGGPHRSDLCEACMIWGDCQKICVQPSAIYQVLMGKYNTKCKWTMNKYGDGLHCNVDLLECDDGYIVDNHYHFEVRPYVNCVYVDYNKLYGQKNNFSPRQTRNNKKNNRRKRNAVNNYNNRNNGNQRTNRKQQKNAAKSKRQNNKGNKRKNTRPRNRNIATRPSKRRPSF